MITLAIMKKTLNDNRGITYISTAVIVLVVSALFAAVFNFAKTMTVLRNVRNETTKVLDSCVIENAKVIYSSIKQGNNKAESIEGMSLLERYSLVSGAEISGNSLCVRNSDGKTVYEIIDPVVSLDSEGKLRLKAEFSVRIPVKMFEITAFYVTVPMSVSSNYVNYLAD